MPSFRHAAALIALALPILLGGCESLSSITPWDGDKTKLARKLDPTTLTPEELYNTGVDAMNTRRFATAIQQFDLVEQTYPYSSWAVNAQLMQGYVDYQRNNYSSSINTLDRFIQLHPSHRDIAYAYYLRALSFYEQIPDIRREQKGTQEAMGALQEVINRFPDSAYAKDARLKMDLARDHLAGKEMEVGRWYQRQKIYTAALNRFQTVVDQYQTTNHVAEALHRMTEIYLVLGLKDQAGRTAAVLGHNYPGSEWYQDSYDTLIQAGVVAGSARPRGEDRPGFLTRTWRSIF